ncbi:MAG: VCBS repeat-containing protein [Desulfovibrionaceae bacterium]|nr:VCBS repeat-containing protein [Desulfovibrionaceae bacterium]
MFNNRKLTRAIFAVFCVIFTSIAVLINISYADEEWTQITIKSPFQDATGIAAADIDGDGDMDVFGLSGDSGNTVAWFENTDGIGAAWVMHTIENRFSYPHGLKVSDVDGDGDVDLVVASHLGNKVVWFENADGAGGAWVKHTIDDYLGYAGTVEVADLDGDVDPDVLAIGWYTNELAWYENPGTRDGDWEKRVVDPTFTASPRGLSAKDVDGDGDMDFFSTAYDTGKVVWFQNADGKATTWTRHDVASGFSGAHQVSGADIDGDGDMDVIASGHTAAMFAWFENKDGQGLTWQTHYILQYMSGAMDVNAADIDGDGDFDAVVSAILGDVVAYFENKDGVGGSWTTHFLSESYDSAADVGVADMDGDGDTDIISSGRGAGQLTWWRNDRPPALSVQSLSLEYGWSFATGNTVTLTGFILDGETPFANKVVGADDPIGAVCNAAYFTTDSSGRFQIVWNHVDYAALGNAAQQLTFYASGYSPMRFSLVVRNPNENTKGYWVNERNPYGTIGHGYVTHSAGLLTAAIMNYSACTSANKPTEKERLKSMGYFGRLATIYPKYREQIKRSVESYEPAEDVLFIKDVAGSTGVNQVDAIVAAKTLLDAALGLRSEYMIGISALLQASTLPSGVVDIVDQYVKKDVKMVTVVSAKLDEGLAHVGYIISLPALMLTSSMDSVHVQSPDGSWTYYQNGQVLRQDKLKSADDIANVVFVFKTTDGYTNSITVGNGNGNAGVATVGNMLLLMN